MRFSALRRMRRVAGWAMPILAAVFFTPAAAHASCGDYVLMKSGTGTMTAQHGPMDANHSPGHKPCTGPMCSSGPVVPLAPAPATPPLTFEEWGCFWGMLFLDSPDRTSCLFAPLPRCPVRQGSSIYHPPRPILSSRSA